MLDPALTRPGRLSRRVVVPLPDERGRADILAVHMRMVPLSPELDRSSACRALAKITSGFSGAELANVVNEAALLAGRKEAEVLSFLRHIDSARAFDKLSSCSHATHEVALGSFCDVVDRSAPDLNAMGPNVAFHQHSL